MAALLIKTVEKTVTENLERGQEYVSVIPDLRMHIYKLQKARPETSPRELNWEQTAKPV